MKVLVCAPHLQGKPLCYSPRTPWDADQKFKADSLKHWVAPRSVMSCLTWRWALNFPIMDEEVKLDQWFISVVCKHFSMKNQTTRIWGLRAIWSLSQILNCHYDLKATIDKTKMSVCGCVPIKPFLYILTFEFSVFFMHRGLLFLWYFSVKWESVKPIISLQATQIQTVCWIWAHGSSLTNFIVLWLLQGIRFLHTLFSYKNNIMILIV